MTFDDVAGVEEAKQELVEVVEFLKEPGKLAELGGKLPKGVLLVGPPRGRQNPAVRRGLRIQRGPGQRHRQ